MSPFYISGMGLRRHSGLRAAIATWVAIALSLSLAAGLTGSPPVGHPSSFRAAVGDAHAAPQSGPRRLGVEASSNVRPPDRHGGAGTFALAFAALVTGARAGRFGDASAATPSAPRPRRLTFRYDATAPPAAQ